MRPLIRLMRPERRNPGEVPKFLDEPCPVLEGEASVARLALTAGGSWLLAYSDGPRHLEKINLRNQSLAKRRRDRLHHPRLLTYIAITRRRRLVRLVLAGSCMPLVAFVLSLLLRYALLCSALLFLQVAASSLYFKILSLPWLALLTPTRSSGVSFYFMSRPPSLSLVPSGPLL